jgi:predicted DNA-binding transcriptional regulator AlpA
MFSDSYYFWLMTKVRGTNSLVNSGLTPRLLNREQAASYLGISASAFDKQVADRVVPGPKSFGSRRVWDIRQLDAAIDRLPSENGASDESHADDVWSRAAL